MGRRKRILIVDDEPANLALLEAIIEPLGHQTVQATNGAEALALLDGGVDLVLLDAMMPVINGFETARRIRNDPFSCHIPIMMITILSNKEDRLRAVEAGANDFITKPVDRVELHIRMESLLKMKEAQDARLESEARYRMLVENAPVGIVSCDLDGRVTEINSAAANILGLPVGQVPEPLNVLAFEPLVDALVADALRNCMETGEPGVGEFPYTGPLGKQIHLRANVVPIRSGDGEITGVQAVVEDISNQKRAEGLLVRSVRLKALVEMASGMANSFRDIWPIVAADAQTALTCLETRNLVALRPVLEHIRETTQQAAQTVRSLNQFARARSAAGQSKGKVLDLSHTVREAIEMTQQWWKTIPERQGIEIALHTDLTPECYIEGEQDDVLDVVVNLIKNAAEALPSGGTISVQTVIEGGQIFLHVRDDGVGIPRQNINKMGEPFWTTKPSHAGMGLAVSFGIVRRHHGTVNVTSKTKQGSIFTVGLPLVEKPATGVAVLPRELSERTFRVLVIGAGDPDLTLGAQDLQRLGHRVLVAETGQQGLKMFEEAEVDAILCNLAMPDMDGWDVSKAIKAYCAEKGMAKPVFIGMTPNHGRVAIDEILDNPHVDRTIGKPFTASAVVEILREEIQGEVTTRPAFSGNIEGIDILEYVQLMLLTGQQIVLEIISNEGVRGFIFLDRGVIFHATCGTLEGEEAFFRCLQFMGGSFSHLPWRAPEKVTINKPGEFLLFEAARKRDEERDDTVGLST